MREIGIVKQVQIQRSSLKLGERPHRIYSPTPILVVDAIRVAPSGVIGVTSDRGEIVDIHNAHHLQSRNSGVNGVSVGFTAHYRAMRAAYGEHLIDGCAGENILVETDSIVKLGNFGKRLAFQDPQTGEARYLDDVIVAAPCVEFSHFVHKANLQMSPLSAEVVKATLQFLDDGMRGFYAAVRKPLEIQVGDKVFAVDDIP
jgi:hypothetical protein